VPIINKAISMVYAAMLIMVIAFPLHAQSSLMIPINTAFIHADHHWIMWLPKHPVYEAVEVMSVNKTGSPQGKALRVFFTERNGGKRQVYYFNEASAAQRWRGEAYHRDIEYKSEGAAGSPQNVFVRFKDKDDRAVELSIQFEKNQKLATEGAGLSNQMGHSADSLFLLFYREKAVATTKGRLLIGGEDYSYKEGQTGSKPGYRFNTYSATITYGQSRFTWNQDGLTNSWGRVFGNGDKSNSEMVYRSKPFLNSTGEQSVIEITANREGEIRQYKHHSGGRAFQIEFAPALPTIESAKSGQVIRYQMSFDNFKNLIEGVLSVKKEENMIVLDLAASNAKLDEGLFFAI